MIFQDWTSTDWTAAAAWATFGVAAAAAWFASRQVLHARDVRNEQSRPFVIVDLDAFSAGGGLIELVIRNVGSTVARNVRITFDKPVMTTIRPDGYDLANDAMFKAGIPVMPPGKEIRLFFDAAPARNRSGLPATYLATVSVEDFRGKRVEPDLYPLDLGHLADWRGIRPKDMDALVQQVTKISDSIKDHRGLLVRVRDDDAQRYADRWQYQNGGHSPSLADAYPAGEPAPNRFEVYEFIREVRRLLLREETDKASPLDPDTARE